MLAEKSYYNQDEAYELEYEKIYHAHHPDAYKEEEQKRSMAQKRQERDYKAFRHQVLFLVMLGICCYFANVVLSESYITRTNALLQLKRQEAALLGENETLKIDVDKLKSPERITELASSRLGLSTARSNIYMHAGSEKVAEAVVQYAKK